MNYCVKCGNKLAPGLKFCTSCRLKLSIDDQTPSRNGTAAPVSSKQPLQQERQKQQGAAQQQRPVQQPKPMQRQTPPRTAMNAMNSMTPEPPKKKTGLMIGIIAAILVLSIGIGAGAAILLGGDKEPEQEAANNVVYVPVPAGETVAKESTAEAATETKKPDETKENSNQVTIETKKPAETKENSNQVTIETKKPQNTSPYAGQKFPDSSERYISASELSGMSRDEIQLCINDIYARHGYIFKDDGLRAYYQSQSWYRGTNGDMNGVAATFNSYERANVELFASYTR